ncbi:MAG: RsmD family RNA methyltransferase, partial [Candidatus Aureabacteria bacterium]|nr:RsmD family RNA methyltransferase [Candidatus Auribacterota bacterium]
MRVISGTAKGITLEAPRGSLVRPTLDRVKETIFNVIAKAVNGANALDLFAGTGQLGIEALS